MRLATQAFGLFIITILLYGIYSVSTLLSLLREDGSADAIRNVELHEQNRTQHSNLPPQLIPKIIHQTYINASVPDRWREPWQSCQDLHPDYEIKLWTDATARAFLEAEFSWFLPTYDAYPYPIQRADAIRYFLLAHFGGTYLDLDVGCARRLDPLLSYPAWLHLTRPTGISNDAMAATPNHPFFRHVIAHLQAYDRNWGLGYVTVMSTTGPLFLSVAWKKWMVSGANRGDGATGGRLRILAADAYQGATDCFFSQFIGSSWHGADALWFVWVGEHWFLWTLVGVLAGFTMLLAVWWTWVRIWEGIELLLHAGRRGRNGEKFWDDERRKA